MNNIITNLLIKEHIISAEDSNIYNYGIFVLLFNLSSILSIILISVILNSISFSLRFLSFFMPIRIIAGGFHCKNEKNCFISFFISYLVILLVSKIFNNTQLCLYLALIILLIINLLYIKSKNHSIFKICILIISISYCIILLNNCYLTTPIMYANLLNLILYTIPLIINQKLLDRFSH